MKKISAKVITIDLHNKRVAVLPYSEGMRPTPLEPTFIPLSAFGNIKMRDGMSFSYIMDDKRKFTISDVYYE